MEQKYSPNLGVRWILVLGLCGFFTGFIGPMILMPEANQGPMLGIFITGPIGVAVGLTLWLLSRGLNWSESTQKKILYSCCALQILSVVAMALTPNPKWRGRLYTVEIKNCRHPSAESERAIGKWSERMKAHAWKSPRPDWQEDLKRTLQANSGSVIETKVLSERLLKEVRNGQFEAYPITSKGEHIHSYYIAENCDSLSPGTNRAFFVDSRASLRLMPTEKDPWPPTDVASLLMLATVVEVPVEFRQFFNE